jgi:hypothetical protein
LFKFVFVLFAAVLLLLLPQMRVYDDESEESKHRKEEIAALGASNPTAVYRCGSSIVPSG